MTTSRRITKQSGLTIIFDGDDTLWSTMPFYTDAKQRFQRLIAQLNWDSKSAVARLDEIDRQNVDRFGFNKNRFPTSMVQAYRELALAHHQEPQSKFERKVRQIGESVFERKARRFPGVLSTLKRLYQHNLILLTKGDAQVQAKRIKDSGLRSLFRSIYIEPSKGPAQFRAILRSEKAKAQRTWTVGDSLKSDIQPALDLGLNAIWIPKRTWAYEELESVPNHKHLYVCESICDVPKIIERQ